MTDRSYAARVTMFRGALPAAVDEARQARSLVLCTRSLRDLVRDLSGGMPVTVPESIGVAVADRLAALAERDRAGSVLAVGGGSVIDVAKVVASRRGVPLTVLPSVLSCNAFATGKAVLRSAGGVLGSVDVSPAARVWVDPTVLDGLDYRLHALGIADALSIRTALADWRVAAAAGAEPVDPLVFGLAQALGDHVHDRALDLTAPPDRDAAEGRYAELLRIVELSGWVTALHGSGRPESGSEHRVARALEQRGWNGRVWHGESVLTGILVAAECHALERDRMYRVARAVGLGRRLGYLGIGRRELAESILGARGLRRDRFTVLDAEVIDARAALGLAERVLGTLLDGDTGEVGCHGTAPRGAAPAGRPRPAGGA